GTYLFMLWVALGCLMSCINPIVYGMPIVPLWPPATHNIIVADDVAILVFALCITRRLQLAMTKVNKRYAAYIDLVIGLRLSSLQSFFVQGHFLEDIGCWPVTVTITTSYLSTPFLVMADRHLRRLRE
ncbi:hypothetical protein BV25DRAFT_1816729, partial [Artomyces pyxidatus]